MRDAGPEKPLVVVRNPVHHPPLTMASISDVDLRKLALSAYMLPRTAYSRFPPLFCNKYENLRS